MLPALRTITSPRTTAPCGPTLMSVRAKACQTLVQGCQPWLTRSNFIAAVAFKANCSTNATAPPAAGEACRPFTSRGCGPHGLNAGAFTTFWNIHGANKFGTTVKELDKCLCGPYLNFVGQPRDMTYPILNGKVSRSWYVDRGITPNNLRPDN
jgi:hypothetical protein